MAPPIPSHCISSPRSGNLWAPCPQCNHWSSSYLGLCVNCCILLQPKSQHDEDDASGNGGSSAVESSVVDKDAKDEEYEIVSDGEENWEVVGLDDCHQEKQIQPAKNEYDLVFFPFKILLAKAALDHYTNN
ncbi:hypothetical protein Sjap_025064 [Stephania japonica]|uniref:Uncharacterized protein n=1 Tax=Stephania japonica TaxID=461633 RepID=A0AAP0E8S0_9MAGN